MFPKFASIHPNMLFPWQFLFVCVCVCVSVCTTLTVYSVYSMCEYLVVLTNVAFHTIQAIDLQNDYYITVALPRFGSKHTHHQ